MWLTEWQRERAIRRVLVKLSRQRLALVLDGNTWVIEKAVDFGDESTASALRTCHLRGWAEPLENRAVPTGQLTEKGKLPGSPIFTAASPIYRLTDAGWNAIHRIHPLVATTLLVAGLTFLATLLGLWMQFTPRPCG